MAEQQFGKITLGWLPLNATITKFTYEAVKSGLGKAKADDVDALFVERGRILAEKDLASGEAADSELWPNGINEYNFQMKEVLVGAAAANDNNTDQGQQQIREDKRNGLCLFVKLMKDDSVGTFSNAYPGVDYYIHLFYNGSWCTSRLVSHSSLVYGGASVHTEVFHGLRMGTGFEKAWILSHQEYPPGVASADRWSAINTELVGNINFLSQSFPVLGSVAEYASTLATVPPQQVSHDASQGFYGLIDVVIVSGIISYDCLILMFFQVSGRRKGYSGQPILLGSASSSKHYDPEFLRNLDPLLHPNATLSSLTLQQPALPISLGTDQALTQQQSMLPRYVTTDSQKRRRVDDNEEINTPPSDNHVTGYSSALASVFARMERPESSIASLTRRIEEAGVGEDGGGTTAAAGYQELDIDTGLDHNTALVLRNLSPYNGSCASDRAPSPAYTSTSDDTIANRIKEPNMKLSRQKRRHVHHSDDFDSEDAIAMIPDKSTSKMRVVPHNEKPSLPHLLHATGSTSQHRNPDLPKAQRVRQQPTDQKHSLWKVNNNNPRLEVGPTSRDMSQWVRSQAHAHDQTPATTNHHNIIASIPRTFEFQTAEETMDYGTYRDDNGSSVWEQFSKGNQAREDQSNRLHQECVVSVSDQILRHCKEDEMVDDWEACEVVCGVRFVLR